MGVGTIMGGFNTVIAHGLGQSLGDTHVTAEPFYSVETVWYVNSATGVDAADPNGRSPAKPFATLGYAVTSSGSQDTIVLMDGHAETIAAAITPNSGQIIVGGGSSGGLPTAKLTLNAAASGMFTVSGARVQLRNIWFNANAQANTTPMITVTGASFLLKDCYFQMAQYDDNVAVKLTTGAAYPRIEGTTFVSTATALTAQPYTPVLIDAVLAGITLSGVTFDGGTTGFSTGYAMLVSAGVTGMRIEDLTLANGSDIYISSGSATVTVSGITSDDSAAIRWA